MRHDRLIEAVLISLGRQDFGQQVNIAEFFNTIGRTRTFEASVYTWHCHPGNWQSAAACERDLGWRGPRR
jgi:hypothetical protein